MHHACRYCLGQQTTVASDHSIAPESHHRIFPNGGWTPIMTSKGFKWGCAKAILSSFVSGVELSTSVLIALASDLSTNKPRQGQHKFWRYVSPIRTYFAWLPEQLAHLLPCSLGNAPPSPPWRRAPFAGTGVRLQHSMVFQNIYHIGDTKSAQELEVFLRMPRERLRLCCGIQCTDSFHPNGPRVNSPLQHSNFCGLQLELRLSVVRMRNKGHLKIALLPLLQLEDGEEILIFGALCLYWCDVELHM